MEQNLAVKKQLVKILFYNRRGWNHEVIARNPCIDIQSLFLHNGAEFRIFFEIASWLSARRRPMLVLYILYIKAYWV